MSYLPCYDHNGDIVAYVSESGGLSTQYVYDPYGNLLAATGPLASQFAFGFSTKIHDREVGLISYQRRFYSPSLGRWLNRDPTEEDGGENLYACCKNNLIGQFDSLGLEIIVIRHLPGTSPDVGWKDGTNEKCLALTVYSSPKCTTTEIQFKDGTVSYSVTINPPNSFVDVYFRSADAFSSMMRFEMDHISVAQRHEQAIQDFKREVEAIRDCPRQARERKNRLERLLIEYTKSLEEENDGYDKPGGPHHL